MNVLQVTHRYPPQVGGVETHVREVSERLVELGHEVTVFSADARLDGLKREVRNGVAIRRFRALSPGGAFYFAPSLVTAIRRMDTDRLGSQGEYASLDVVHAHNYHALPSMAAAAATSNARFVYTPHYHAASASGFRDALLSFYRPLGGWGIQRADRLIAVSEWESGRLKADFGVDATVIPSGLDIERFADADPHARDRPYLLTVGRLEEYKGIQHVIRSLPDLPEYDLLVVGRGPFRLDLERVAMESGVADRVDFLGFVEDDRLARLYAGAALYVNLSSFEAYGMAVAEALAAGTVCVVRDEAALGDWLPTPGVVGVDSVDVDRVVAAIRTAEPLDQPSVDLPTWSDCASRIEDVYRTASDEKDK